MTFDKTNDKVELLPGHAKGVVKVDLIFPGKRNISTGRFQIAVSTCRFLFRITGYPGTHLMVVIAISNKDYNLEQQLTMLLATYSNTRYISKGPYQWREIEVFTSKVHRLSDKDFRSRFKMTRESLAAIINLIEKHPGVHNNSNHSQAHPGWQPAVALQRFANGRMGAG
ncbi:hypothetical protein BGZ58_002663 [Dissophora ornata]|nr:hypothetical protein BGZ58_002663 [Dissophora ornata]